MKIVTYLRVSTAKQGQSGLGLEAQQASVRAFARARGHAIVAEFVEVESAAKSSRPQLSAALASCRLHRATLAIAKLDRLARNVAFIANLMDGGVDFVACDMPHANRLTLHLLAAIAEHERETISQRTKAALQAAKARGVTLGNPYGTTHLWRFRKAAAARSAEVRKSRSEQSRSAVLPFIQHLLERGVRSNTALAQALNENQVPSPMGGIWYAETVRRLRRADGAGA